MPRTKIIFFIILIGLLWLPLFQHITGYFTEPGLKGAYTIPGKPKFTRASWNSMQFQKQVEEYENYHFGFRAFFVKFKNSFEYILFRKINAPDIIEGKSGYLFSFGSVNRTLGKFYNGKEKNEMTIKKINFMKEEIEKKGGHLLCIIAPSKESIIPEYLADEYQSINKKDTDYDDFINGYNKYNIPFIDFCSYMKKIQDTSSIPLFTKTGFHWSVYGASIAHDSLLNYVENLMEKPMPAYTRKGIETSDTARFSEADFEEPMNLLFSLNSDRYFYPNLEMVPSSLNNYRPRVIIIGDSFFWQIKNLRKLMYIFSEDSKYWYYFSKSFPLSDLAGCEMKDIDILKELENAELIILFNSLGTTNDFPFGVADLFMKKYNRDF